MSLNTWRQLYIAIIEKLESDLQSLRDDDNVPVFNAVYFSRKAAPITFPCVFVLTEQVRSSPQTPQTSTYEMPFTIQGVGKETSTSEGLKDIINRMGYVETYLIEDRKFRNSDGDSLVDNLEVETLTPEIYRPMTRTRFEDALYVKFVRHAFPGR